MSEQPPSTVEKPTRAAGRTTRRRQPKQDAVLAQAVDVARSAVVDAAGEEAKVGEHLTVEAHEDRLLTHLFECSMPGYRGWHWFATVARAPRTKYVTVCEVGLLAGEDSLLAPEWIPWEERMQAVKDQNDPATDDGGQHAVADEDAAPASNGGETPGEDPAETSTGESS